MRERWHSCKACLIVIAAVVVVVCACEDIPQKSDQEMMNNFRDRRSEFEALLSMVRMDQAKIGGGLFRIDDDWTEPKDLAAFGIDNERVEKYRSIFREIGIPRGFYAYPGGMCFFVASAQGIAPSGKSKGYAWSSKTPDPLIDGDLDEYRKNNFDYLAFRSIEDYWYLLSTS